MSFSGSLLMTGIGAFMYKYDQNQRFEILPDSQTRLKDMGSQVYKRQVGKWSTRSMNLINNFFHDLFTGTPYIYPFKGIIEVFKHKKQYSPVVLGTLISYLTSFVVILTLYWGTVAPLYLAFFAILGPFGVAIASVHSIFHVNMLTMLFMRISHFSNPLVRNCLTLNEYVNTNNVDPVKYYVPVRTSYFWTFHLPMKLMEYLLGIFALFLLLTVSCLPIIGPFLFHLAVSPFVGRIYFSKLYRIKGYSNIQRFENFLTHNGFYVSFGITAGLIESFPIVAGLALSTNSLATAVWEIEN